MSQASSATCRSRAVFEASGAKWSGRVDRQTSPIGVLWWATIRKHRARSGFTCPFRTRREAIAWVENRVK